MRTTSLYLFLFFNPYQYDSSETFQGIASDYECFHWRWRKYLQTDCYLPQTSVGFNYTEPLGELLDPRVQKCITHTSKT